MDAALQDMLARVMELPRSPLKNVVLAGISLCARISSLVGAGGQILDELAYNEILVIVRVTTLLYEDLVAPRAETMVMTLTRRMLLRHFLNKATRTTWKRAFRGRFPAARLGELSSAIYIYLRTTEHVGRPFNSGPGENLVCMQ